MLFFKTFIVAPLLILFSIADSSVTSNSYPSSRHLIFQAGKLGQKPWDPTSSFGVQVNFNSAVFTNLIYVDSKFNIKPGIIKKWDWDFNSNSFTFTIDDTLSFDKSRALKIEDLEFGLVKSFLNPLGNAYTNYLNGIVGSEKLKSGMVFKSGMCLGIKIINSNQLKVTLKQPNANFIYTLENGVPPIAPIEDFKEDGFNFKRSPRGTGTYKIKSTSSNGARVYLVRKLISPEKIRNSKFPLSIEFINEGDPKDNKVDLATAAGSSGIRQDKNYTTVLGKIPESISTIDFNFSQDLGKSKYFREAVSLALDRSKIMTSYMQSKPSQEIIPSQYLGRAGLNYEYSPNKSREIVNKYFKNKFSKNNPIKAIYHGKPGQPLKPYIQVIVSQLENVGIYVRFEGRTVLQQFGKDTNAVMLENGNSVSFTDPLSAVSRFIKFPDKPNLIADPDDKILLDLYYKAFSADSIVSRAAFLKEISVRIFDEFYTIPYSEEYPVFSYNNKILSIDIENRFAAINFDKVIMR